ncbi:hypothetical protein MYX65_03740 [Acidobacteria bacterium AH-259-L09]|nr:hypothetical protein [Acidobacteria bacterium AH-259-L09]
MAVRTAELNESSKFSDDEWIATLRGLSTPALVFDETQLSRTLEVIHTLGSETSCQVLYALKACSLFGVLDFVVDYVDGFACSSLFESTLARSLVTNCQTVHFTSPGLRAEEVREIGETCDYVSLNSIGQWTRSRAALVHSSNCGIRVNPEISFACDERYNPCRKHSRLGVPMDKLMEATTARGGLLRGIRGVHIHNNCDSMNLGELLATVNHLESHLAPLLDKVDWINLGGGYLLCEADNRQAFRDAVRKLQSKYGLKVFIEPGAGIVRRSGYLIARVLDLFQRGTKQVGVLDTSVNHVPEVFEFQFQPDVIGHSEGAPHEYILTGSSCLAGDVFGEYAFDQPLEVGSRVVFSDAGAYTLVKAHMFNGINLPTIYALKENGELEMKKRFTYEDFANRCGVEPNVFV